MSDLADLAFEIAGELPANVRKVIDTATANGWDLSKPGMTLAIRLNHPTDELAQPVYIVWAVGRTEKGNLSFRVDSCGTKGLVPLTGADLLEYLQDPTVIYPTAEEIHEDEVKKAEDAIPAWKPELTVMDNLRNTMGAEFVKYEQPPKVTVPIRPVPPIQPSKSSAAPLRVKLPGAA